jgi:hypothetical protein
MRIGKMSNIRIIALNVVALGLMASFGLVILSKRESLLSKLVSPKDTAYRSNIRAQDELPNAPCWFQSAEGTAKIARQLPKIYKERVERETYGYSSDTPLATAVNLFNQELLCRKSELNLSLLTIEEVIAAAIGGPPYGGEPIWQFSEPKLRKIAVEKMLPKGSLLIAEGGGCVFEQALGNGQVCVQGLRIYLFLNLDKNPRGSAPLRPEQSLLIRKTYFGISSPK